MRLIFRVRPLKFLFLRNWYGVRTGAMWTIPPDTYIYMIDAGILTIGYAK